MKTTVISLGGSLIVPGEVDVKFLAEFRKVILGRKNERLIIVCGGGKTCRHYQNAARLLGAKSSPGLDLIGVASTGLNAELVRVIFMPHSHERVIHNPTEKIRTGKRIIICSGWKPGFSTDVDAVLAARNFGAGRIINLTNVDHVYDRDPAKHRDAKPIEKISWNNFLKIAGKKFMPGMHLPFDPVASRLAKKHRIGVVVMNGRKLGNFKKFLAGKKFVGTVIY